MNKYFIIDTLKGVIADYYNLTKQDLIAKDKSSKVVYPRHIGMYLSRRLANETYPRIGLEFGGRDPQTVVYACKKISKDIKNNENLENTISEIIIEVISIFQNSKDKMQECYNTLNLSINNLDRIDLIIFNLKKHLEKHILMK